MTEHKEYRLNSTAASLLGFLHEGSQSGWDLVETAHERIGNFWSITRSQVYRELKLLEAAGYIIRQEAGLRERQPYRLTSAGREVFRAWVNEEPRHEQIRFPLLLHTSFGSHIDPARFAKYLAKHLEGHENQRRRYEALHAKLINSDSATSVDGLRTLQFGIRYESMVVEWIRQTIVEVQDGASRTKED